MLAEGNLPGREQATVSGLPRDIPTRTRNSLSPSVPSKVAGGMSRRMQAPGLIRSQNQLIQGRDRTRRDAGIAKTMPHASHRLERPAAGGR